MIRAADSYKERGSKSSILFIIVTVKSRIERVEILLVQPILHDAQGFTEPLEMDDLPCAQELDRLTDFLVMDES